MGKFDAPKRRLTMNGGDLDDRQIDGLLLYQTVLNGQTRRIEISNAQSIYLSSKDPGVAYTVERVERNRRGSKAVEYRCSCPDNAKQGRRDCQHRFAEKLLHGDVVVVGEPDVAQIQSRNEVKAGRRPARQRFAYDGRTIRSAQRAGRVRMSREIPRLALSLKAAWDASHNNAISLRRARFTADSVRAAALLLKICEGKSADAMVARYQQLIDDGIFPLRRAPHQNTLTLWMNDASLTPILQEWLAKTAWPFRAREIAGIVDSTKISQLPTAHARLVDYGPKDKRPTARWMKAHVLAGVETLVIMSVGFSKGESNDITYVLGLVNDALKTFSIRFLLGDKAYLSENVLGALWQRSIKAVIPVKSRWDVETKKTYYEPCMELVKWYDERPRLFDGCYRLRSKIEGLFSVLKRVADGYCWSRGRPREGDLSTAWQNETLCKFIYMNLRTTVLLQEETGVEIDYRVPSRFFPPPDEPLIQQDV